MGSDEEPVGQSNDARIASLIASPRLLVEAEKVVMSL